ncbi:aggregation-promoting factor C-terminal-like domain-containing protein [Nocardioides bizhenqiangii]|uniref:Transglycosylase SLT domain-containing protein n=1 Tax=Nocardioides bizhenqiangii TaxID=3095076 RepID=A0ABZ0ZRT1_9ACTN|nr:MULTISPECIES: transglycosylase SLT domain-containing protein [unclassified Nocardioides]MDZ5619494.1 transglycosylase SLT domain-containing protein [Nocardioides sp. HM23]WQQ26489.1 transglycosylase SLT domain-containing protein [Nocardioides sp. HM61]
MGGSRSAAAAALLAVALTGCAATEPDTSGAPEEAAPTSTDVSPDRPERSQPTSRAEGGARFEVPDEVILQQLRLAAERIARNYTAPPTPTATPIDIDPGTNRALGYRLMLDFGFAEQQWQYLDALWHRESGWNHLADNPTSSAYGIPQSLPGTKMAVVGPDWRTNPETQIRWGLAYIAARYGSPERAWAHSERVGWY